MGTDYNLLFGVLALQMELITHEQFLEACALWAHRKHVPLADILAERSWLAADDRQQVERLVERKLRKHGGDARATLAEVAGEPVQRSLADLADAEVQQSLAQLPHLNVALVATVAYEPGSRDRYTLSRLHAKGGIGQVWVARDEEIGREIALKELRPERADEAALVQRFLSEARITGQLEHPGIVPVYALACHPESGKPFYTMRFVRGRTLAQAITEFHQTADYGALPLRNLLNALVAVCNAVAYAHSRGVVHRDLKPSNVVLGDFGEVVVLDWGLAKLLGQAESAGEVPRVELETSSQTAGTVLGAVMGTPAYMAPEQADGRSEAIDARTDVYGLGAILYELLTGQPPFVGGETHEILRRVQHEMPARPRSLRKAAPAALEAICMQALAKLRADRYPTVRELADDVQHWLADEQVSAYGEPLLARVRRWGRRHRTLVASGVAAVGMAAVALTVISLSLSGKNAALAAANARESTARQHAQANFEVAKEAVEKYLDKVTENEKLKQADFYQLRKELLETALPFYQKVVNEQDDDPQVEAARGRALGRLSRLQGDLGETAAAIGSLQEMRQIFSTLGADYPDQPNFRHFWGQSCRRLGGYQIELGQLDEALASYEEAIRIAEALSDQFSNEQTYRMELASSHDARGSLLKYLGRTDKAQKEYLQSIDLRHRLVAAAPDDPDFRADLAQSHANMAGVQEDLNQMADAESHLRRAVAIRGQLLAEEPTNPDRLDAEATIRRRLGTLLGDRGRYPEATECYQSAINTAAKLGQQFPSVPGYRESQAAGHLHYGLMLNRQGKRAEAMAEHKAAIEIQKRLVADFPHIYRHRQDLAASYNNLAMTRDESADETLNYYRLARDMYARLSGELPRVPLYRHHLANTRHNLGMRLVYLKRTKEAEAEFLAALVLREELVAAYPQVRDHVVCLAKTRGQLGALLADTQRQTEGLSQLDKAIESLEAIARQAPQLVEIRGPLRHASWWKAELLSDMGRVGESAPYWDRAVQLTTDLQDAAFLRHKRAWAWVYAGEHAKALEEINDLEKLGRFDDFKLQDLALLCALSAAKIAEGKAPPPPSGAAPLPGPKTAKPYADRAMELLRKGVQAGYDDLAALKNHPDWAVLRPRSDFQELLKQIEARQAKGKQ